MVARVQADWNFVSHSTGASLVDPPGGLRGNRVGLVRSQTRPGSGSVHLQLLLIRDDVSILFFQIRPPSLAYMMMRWWVMVVIWGRVHIG